MYSILHYADNVFSMALYGLIVFYDLTKEELAGRRPLAKFLSIKLIVLFTFFQTLLVRVYAPLCPSPANFHMLKFTALEGHVIHGTEFWTSTNIADGLNALATCIEASSHFHSYSGFLAHWMQMIFFSVLMMWSFNWKEYQVQPREPHTGIWRPLWDSINLCTPSPSIFSFIGYIRMFLTHLGADICRGLCGRNWLVALLFYKSYYRPAAPARAYQTILRSGFRRERLREGRRRIRYIRIAHEL